ncbi:thioredoxin family protein [Sphingobacterium sp. DR205]|uniref:thioredoxin family protein n=1 Tax=Sphingobacterium sp. DR205 TaxID=2713573 RepID=UPI0013E4DF2D|nr:thioredoxin family protein [Sphingobacterium sp. DR205]QIH36348.1 thioredoxin family protein [Sphingobacterium sp. DR205]
MKYCQKISMLLIALFYPLLHFGQERINWVSFEQLDSLLAVEPRETLIFIHTDWCSYCRKMEREIFTKQNLVTVINKNYYAVSLDAESVAEISFDQSIWKAESNRKKTGQYHPLALLLMQGKQMVFPSILRFDSEFRLKNIQQKYLNSKELGVFLE